MAIVMAFFNILNIINNLRSFKMLFKNNNDAQNIKYIYWH